MSSGIDTKEYGYVNRQSMRLNGYDYSRPGVYFVTISVQDRECLFGIIENRKVVLNKYGKIAYSEWIKTEQIRNEIKLDEFVIMPNHIHGIIIIYNTDTIPVGANGRSPLRNNSRIQMKPKSISSFIAGYKSSVTKQINIMRKTPGNPVWQRNYYDHIIRSEGELNSIRQYIIDNPVNWGSDENHIE
ncbi:MAG: transposase [Spirochaetota bacterium]